MKLKLKTLLYWLSIVRPIADILIGTWKGIQAVLANEKLANENYQIQTLVEDLDIKKRQGETDSEFIDRFFNSIEKKGK